MIKYLLTIILTLSSIISFSQKTIDNNDLPIIIENDTVIVKGSVWVESEDSEIRQRGRENNLKKKLTKLNKILKEKYTTEMAIDSLLQELNKVSRQRDSLVLENAEITKTITQDCKDKLYNYSVKIDELSEMIMEKRKEVKKLKKRRMIYYGVMIGQTIIIVLLI